MRDRSSKTTRTRPASWYSITRNMSPDFFGSTTPSVIAFNISGTTYSDPVLTEGMNYFYLLDDGNAPTTVYAASSNAGLAGDSITLTGTNFASTMADNEVFVAGVQAVVTDVTDTSLTFTIPDDTVTGSVIVSTPKGATAGRTQFIVASSGLNRVSSLAVDAAHVPFVADTGDGIGTWDRIFKFDPATGVRTEVGAMNEATGLPTDASNRVYYGNALVSTANFGTIERTSSAGGEATYRQCGNSATSDNCHVFGIGLDPFLTDFGAAGRVYVADGAPAAQKVRIVPPPGGFITDFAMGFTFGNSPRGIVVDTNPTSGFFHDVFVADSANVRRFDSAVPGTLEKTYNSTNSPLLSPRQIAVSPTPRERLLIADDGRDGLVVINPATDASKVIGYPLVDPRAVAVDTDASGRLLAFVGEATRVLNFPVPRTVYVALWVANGSGIGPQRILNQIDRTNRSLEPCGIEIKIRDDKVNFFDAGTLLDLEAYDITGTTGCGDPLFVRSGEERELLEDASRRSSETTDLNVYFVRSFTLLGAEPEKTAETITADCFAGMTDAIGSGAIVSVKKLDGMNGQFTTETVRTVAHEITHALMDRNSWTSGDEHLTRLGMQPPDTNLMKSPGSRRRWLVDIDQCSNINTDATMFRGDP